VIICMARAYFAPYGVGLGHASRLVTIANRLNGYNASIEFSSYGEAGSFIQMHGFNCSLVPAVELVWSGESGFSFKNSLGNVPSWFTNFIRQVNDEIRNLVSFRPDIVISDSRLSPILSARLLGIPSIVILNQVKLLLSPRLRKLTIARIFEKMNGEFLGGLWNLSERLLIPDLPPPYTISEHNVWDCDSIRKKVEYVGFTTSISDPTPQGLNTVVKTLGINRSMPLVFVHISGPSLTRFSLISRILEAIRDDESEIQYIISEGKPHGKTEPTKVSKSGWYYEWCPVKDEIYRLCDLVVMRAGHTAISQAIRYGKPVVTIPIQNQGEQLGNAAKVSKLGIGIKLDPSNMKAHEINAAIKEVLNNDYYLQNINKIKVVAQDMNGIENVVNIIRSYF
jgi:UDP-N-acetylglucosamine--N-acetylmuramyl-(pentapeptide) pyrophosphoryl-undecaprenol N-acetylglucosamine transferase